MSLTESDKVVLTKYPIAPSKCVVCLRSSNGQLDFIDFQMSLDIYGSVNICVDCLRSVAPLIGLVAGELLAGADDQIRNLVESNRELYENNAKLNATIDSLLSVRPNLKQRDLPADEESDQDSKQLKLDLGVKLKDAGSSDRGSSKSDAVGRSKSVLGTPEQLKFDL